MPRKVVSQMGLPGTRLVKPSSVVTGKKGSVPRMSNPMEMGPGVRTQNNSNKVRVGGKSAGSFGSPQVNIKSAARAGGRGRKPSPTAQAY